MHKAEDFNVERLIERLDEAVLNDRVEEADELTAVLFRLQGGADEIAVMPGQLMKQLKANGGLKTKEKRMKPKRIKKMIYIVATAALVTALSITAVATGFFGVRDLVIRDDMPAADTIIPDSTEPEGTEAQALKPTVVPEQDLIVLQGYPDSSEYKAAVEWSLFCQHYDADGSILDAVGNSSNEYTERYPMYLVYSKDMADKLEEITAKYNLIPHESLTIAENAAALIGTAETGDFLSGASIGYSMLGGYVYNDGTFHFDGQVALQNGKLIDYQFGNYVKGTFSDTYLNVGDADSYKQWPYTAASGVTVSLALGEKKSLLIADLDNSFVTINILTGTAGSNFGSPAITEEDLESFADLFDFSVIK